MADKDNEFLDEHGDAFSPDEEEEFAIPENAFEEDEDISQHADEFGDSFAEDMSIQEEPEDVGLSDEELEIGPDEPVLGEHQIVDESNDTGEQEGYEGAYEEEAPAKQGVGWKAWTGVIALGLVTAGGLAYFVMPDSSPSRNASAQSQQLPSPPEQQSRQSLPQPPQQEQRSQASAPQPPQQERQRNNGPAVNVQAFPGQNQQPASGSRETRSNSPSLSGAQVAGIESASPANQSLSGQSSQVYSRNETQVQQSNQMPVDQSAGQNFGDNGSSVIGGTSASTKPLGDRPGYIAEIENQLAEFASIARIAEQNAKLISNNREDLNEFKTLTNEEIEEIKARLDALESGATRPATKPKGATNQKDNRNATANSESSDNEDGEFEYNIPDTPEEVRELQTLLAEKGYDPGPIDGLMGRQTRLAVKRMQQDHDLPITGWLSAETMMVVDAGPKPYSGKPLSKEDRKMQAGSDGGNTANRTRQAIQPTEQSTKSQWYVRGMTSTKAVVYRTDGMSYAVSVGSEIPGMGQVLEINPGNNEIRTARGLINRRR